MYKEEKIKNLWDEGKTMGEIAKIFNTGSKEIYDILLELQEKTNKNK